MRILVTGATGFIGSYLVRALTRGGYEVIAACRRPAAAQERFPGVRTAWLDFSRIRSVEACLPLLVGVDAVVNAAGIIRETRRQSFRRVHTEAPRLLFDACRLAKVEKVIQISALGTDAAATSQFHLTKRAADEHLKRLGIPWVIIKPSLVYGPGGKSAELFKALAALPAIPLVADGEHPVQPIHINDLTDLVLRLVSPEAPAFLEIDAVGPYPLSVRQMLESYRGWLGLGACKTISIPYTMAIALGRIGGFLGETPLSRDAIHMLQRGSTGDPEAFTKLMGRQPVSFEAALAGTPAAQPDRWHAQLYFLSPALRWAIGVLWLCSAIVSAFFYPSQLSYALLERLGAGALLAPVVLYAAAGLDGVLGLSTLARFRIRTTGTIQVVLTVLYSILASIASPEAWQHPFGPLTKNIPLVVATLVMVALEDKRWST